MADAAEGAADPRLLDATRRMLASDNVGGAPPVGPERLHPAAVRPVGSERLHPAAVRRSGARERSDSSEGIRAANVAAMAKVAASRRADVSSGRRAGTEADEQAASIVARYEGLLHKYPTLRGTTGSPADSARPRRAPGRAPSDPGRTGSFDLAGGRPGPTGGERRQRQQQQQKQVPSQPPEQTDAGRRELERLRQDFFPAPQEEPPLPVGQPPPPPRGGGWSPAAGWTPHGRGQQVSTPPPPQVNIPHYRGHVNSMIGSYRTL
jgi:hypothetical protein